MGAVAILRGPMTRVDNPQNTSMSRNYVPTLMQVQSPSKAANT